MAVDTLPNNVVAKDFGYIKNVLVATPTYLATHTAIRTAHDLSHHQCILSSDEHAWNTWKLKAGCDEQAVSVAGKVAANLYMPTLDLVEAGFGVGNVPSYMVVEKLASGALVRVLPDYVSPVHRLSLIFAQHRVLPNKIKAFKAALQTWRARHAAYFC